MTYCSCTLTVALKLMTVVRAGEHFYRILSSYREGHDYSCHRETSSIITVCRQLNKITSTSVDFLFVQTHLYKLVKLSTRGERRISWVVRAVRSSALICLTVLYCTDSSWLISWWLLTATEWRIASVSPLFACCYIFLCVVAILVSVYEYCSGYWSVMRLCSQVGWFEFCKELLCSFHYKLAA